jgi:hypothetical protein
MQFAAYLGICERLDQPASRTKTLAPYSGGHAGRRWRVPPIRPEGNFPVAIVAGHGMLAVSTLILALLTTLG